MRQNSFPRERRIRHRGEFRLVQREGRRVLTHHLVYLIHPNPTGASRLGLIVSRKVGNAVVRNRIKRVIREVFRTQRPFDQCGVDIVVIPRRSLPKNAPFALVWRDFEVFSQRAEPLIREMGSEVCTG